MYDGRFEVILEDVLRHEGGYVDNPVDRGGPTNMGITIPFLADARGVSKVSIEPCDIKNLTLDQARQAYHKNLWQRANIKLLPVPVDWFIFDWAVMSGPRVPIRLLQEYVGVKKDGVLGPVTAAAVRAKVQQQPAPATTEDLSHRAIVYFIRICKRDPSQIAFLEGWFNRFESYL